MQNHSLLLIAFCNITRGVIIIPPFFLDDTLIAKSCIVMLAKVHVVSVLAIIFRVKEVARANLHMRLRAYQFSACCCSSHFARGRDSVGLPGAQYVEECQLSGVVLLTCFHRRSLPKGLLTFASFHRWRRVRQSMAFVPKSAMRTMSYSFPVWTRKCFLFLLTAISSREQL